MTPHKKRTCPLTKRLAEDMLIRNMAEATIDAYTYHVRKFADFIEKPPNQATCEDVRTFQIHLIQEQRQRQQGTADPALTEALERAESLLAQVQADRLAVPGEDSGRETVGTRT